MATENDGDLLTIAEAAALLKVSRITLHRWLKHGRLQAFHVGPKAVRIRRGDLAKVITPARRREVTAMKEAETGTFLSAIRALTADEKRRGQEALSGSQALIERMLAQRGGLPVGESWPLIRDARDERSAPQR